MLNQNLILKNKGEKIMSLFKKKEEKKYQGQTNLIHHAIGGGIAEITPESTTITADMVEDGANSDIDAIRSKKEEARKLLEEYKNK